MSKPLFAAACVCFLAVPALRADSPWTEEDVVNAESAVDFQVSPDGRFVVWVRSSPNEDKGEQVGQLFRTRLADGREVQLTRGEEACVHPRWSPDGKRIAFLSTRRGEKKKKPKPTAKRVKSKSREDKEEDEPKPQLWLMDAMGGEPWRLTELSRAIGFFAWAGPEAILFAAKEEPTLREKTLKKEDKDDTIVVEDERHEPPVRLFRVEVGTGKITRLTDNRDWIQSLAVSPDGKRVVAIHTRSLRYVYDNHVKPAVILHDLEAGRQKLLFQDRKFNLTHVAWTPDGKGFYACSQFTTHPRYLHASITEVYHHDLASGATVPVDLGWERGLGLQSDNGNREGLVVTADGFLALLADGLRNRAARFVRTGPRQWKRTWLEGEHVSHLFGLAASPDGKTVVYAHSTAASPTRWLRARLQGNQLLASEPTVDVNDNLRKKTIAKVEVMRWKGARDEEVEGLLFYPRAYKPGQKAPLVVMIHGGPFGADLDSWEERWAYAAQLFAQRGAFVLKPNYHGSSNYGLKWAESLAGGNYYELPLVDIERGVEALIARGLADPARLGTMGWSNGAILSAALITRNPRYRAASLGAGGAEWVADWGACEFGASFSNYYLGKSPLEDPQLYIKMAPLYQFDRVRTPTIIFQGDADRAVPPHHAWAQFRTLQALGKVDVRLLIFPDEEHGLKKLAHQRRKLKEEMAWFDRHLFGKPREEDLALDADSPLALALKLRKVRRTEGKVGFLEKGVLLPETVSFEGMVVGRFEVTAAQYAAFDATWRVEPGKENYPATGVTFEKARAYCAWLSKQTAKTYRLPTELEAEMLYEEREADGENTLDYWAGHAVNPEDARRLREKVKELGGRAPLLREVGKFKAAGEASVVFDLGGNAAEWVVATDGKGRPAGGCAILPADEKIADRVPPAEYIGFRVVVATPKKQDKPAPRKP